MTTKFNIGDMVEIAKEEVRAKYKVIAIMTITSATDDIRYEIRNPYGQKYVIEEKKLVKARMTKDEARNMALEYIDNYLVEHDSDDYHIEIKKEDGYCGAYYYRVYVSDLGGEIITSKTFNFSKKG